MDYEKEEKWLNEMSAKGFAFSNFAFGRYTFTDCRPGEYIYRLELLEKSPKNPESQKYLRFLEESGVELVSSWIKFAYLRKKAEDGSFEIFTDSDSLLQHYRRISMLWLPFIFIWATLCITRLMIGLDQLNGGEGDFILTLFLLGLSVIFTAVFAYHWNKLRKKTKKLKQEKRIRE